MYRLQPVPRWRSEIKDGEVKTPRPGVELPASEERRSECFKAAGESGSVFGVRSKSRSGKVCVSGDWCFVLFYLLIFCLSFIDFFSVWLFVCLWYLFLCYLLLFVVCLMRSFSDALSLSVPVCLSVSLTFPLLLTRSFHHQKFHQNPPIKTYFPTSSVLTYLARIPRQSTLI